MSVSLSISFQHTQRSRSVGPNEPSAPHTSALRDHPILQLRGFHSHGGTPIAGWFIRENPTTKMDDDWGYRHFWKPPFQSWSAYDASRRVLTHTIPWRHGYLVSRCFIFWKLGTPQSSGLSWCSPFHSNSSGIPHVQTDPYRSFRKWQWCAEPSPFLTLCSFLLLLKQVPAPRRRRVGTFSQTLPRLQKGTWMRLNSGIIPLNVYHILCYLNRTTRENDCNPMDLGVHVFFDKPTSTYIIIHSLSFTTVYIYIFFLTHTQVALKADIPWS